MSNVASAPIASETGSAYPGSHGAARRGDRGALALLVALVALFVAPWWNRYFGGTLEGYFLHFGEEIARGRIPYRDFYLHVPPLLPLEGALLERWADHPLIAARALGALERILLAALLFAWLRQAFRRETAFAAVLLATALGSCNDTEVLLLYNHQSILLAVVAGLLATLDLDRTRPRAPTLLASGAAAGLALMCKQTTGLGVVLALGGGLGAALFVLRGARSAARAICLWAAGLAAALLPFVVWLGANGALRAFFQQVFGDGPANKGPLVELALRVLESPWTIPAYRVPVLLAAIGVLLMVRPLRRGLRQRPPRPGPGLDVGPPPLALLGVACASTLVLGAASARFVEVGLGWLRLPVRAAALVGFWGSVVILLLALRTARVHLPTPRVARLGLMAGASCALAYMLSLSWAVQPAMALPGFALTAALVVEGMQPERLPFGLDVALPRAFVAACALVLLVTAWNRQIDAFDFAGWREPPIFAPRAASAPAGLEGFRVSRETAAFVERVVDLVRAETREGERVLAFSQIPFVNLLAGRERATFAALHWYDVTPDRVCRADLVRLQQDPPAAIVLWPMTEEEIALHERAFRGGRPSGQRELWAGLRKLVGERYRRAGTARAPGGVEVEVWRRTG